MEPKIDCRFYNGEKPCRFKRLCDGCPEYSPMGTRIAVIKLGAIGDALRTTPVLRKIAERHPLHQVTWFTDRQSLPVLRDNTGIHRLIILEPDAVFRVLPEQFDLLYCLDKDPAAISLAEQLRAHRKYGYRMSRYGTLDIFNDAARYSLMLGLDDNLKFYRNKKTYQETIFEMAEFEYGMEFYSYIIPESAREAARVRLEGLHMSGSGPCIGLNTGCGTVFATKRWPETHFESLARLLKDSLDARIYLLGGESEQAVNARMEGALAGLAVNTGSMPLAEFAGVLERMDLVVSGDTLAMHLSLAMGTRTVALFGPTCPQEIEFYGNGIPVTSGHDCLFCYKSACRQAVNECMARIQPGTVREAVETLLKGDSPD